MGPFYSKPDAVRALEDFVKFNVDRGDDGGRSALGHVKADNRQIPFSRHSALQESVQRLCGQTEFDLISDEGFMRT